jgi:hypothetical protein
MLRVAKPNFGVKPKRVVGPIKAYICADDWSKRTVAAKTLPMKPRCPPKKRDAKQLKKQDKNRVLRILQTGSCSTSSRFLIEDDGAKSVLWDIGQSAISNSLLYEAVKTVEANETLQEIVTSAVKTRGFGHLLAELSEREDLREFTEAAAANDEPLSLLATVAAEPTLQDILRAIITAPGLGVCCSKSHGGAI